MKDDSRFNDAPRSPYYDDGFRPQVPLPPHLRKLRELRAVNIQKIKEEKESINTWQSKF